MYNCRQMWVSYNEGFRFDMLYRLAYNVNAHNKEDFIMRHLRACKAYRFGRTKHKKYNY